MRIVTQRKLVLKFNQQNICLKMALLHMLFPFSHHEDMRYWICVHSSQTYFQSSLLRYKSVYQMLCFFVSMTITTLHLLIFKHIYETWYYNNLFEVKMCNNNSKNVGKKEFQYFWTKFKRSNTKFVL